MKKTLVIFLCAILIFSFSAFNALAEEELKIVSGTVLNGESEASASLVLRYQFSSEINDLTVDEIYCKPTAVSEVKVDGANLEIRLLHMMPYDTEHTLDLSLVTSKSGKKYEENGGIIKFTTKYGSKGKIYEDDFEIGASTILKNEIEGKDGAGEAVLREGDNGNWSYKMGTGTLTPVAAVQSECTISDKFIMEFDFLAENVATDYGFISILGNNGLKGDEAKSYESRKLFMYDVSENKFGVLYNQDNATTNSSALHAGVTLNEGWNKIRAIIDLQTQSIELYVNGVQAEDGSGNKQFKFPCYNASTKDCRLTFFRVHKLEAAQCLEGGGIYLDNFAFMQTEAPIFIDSSIKEGQKVSLSCPEVTFRFKNSPTELLLNLGDTPISRDDIRKNADGSFTAYLSLSWEESYVLNGTVKGLYDTESNFTINFETGTSPAQLIEVEGFFSDDGKRLNSIVPGNVTAKIKVWQDSSRSYVFLLGVHRVTDGRDELISLSSPQIFTSSENPEEKELMVTVPENTSGCYVKIYALKDTLTRLPYNVSLYSGSRVLK